MDEAPTNQPSALLEALRAADAALPEALSTFDGIAASHDAKPDFQEWSARLSDVCDAARLTYYFDVARRGPALARTVSARFSTLAEALGARVPRVFQETLDEHAEDPAILQLVLGVDERLDGMRRVKVYAVLRDAAPELVAALLGAAGVAHSAAFEAEKVYIAGFDFGDGGVLDAKLYYRLERARLGRAVANLDGVRDLLAATRYVVLQRCTRSSRSQIYLHADNADAIQRHLDARAVDGSPAATLAQRHAAAARGLARGRLEPWIVSFLLEGHRLRRDASTIYFHHVGVDAS
jgi:hypothetical protein